MKQKVRLGLTYTAALATLWVVLAHPTGEVKFPSNIPTEIKRTKATWEEKGENKEIARTYASAGWGWSGKQWLCLHDLWMRESRFDHLASNQQGSSAFGIAQRLGETSRNPRIQILRGLRYVEHRHLTPCKALAFHKRFNYY